MAKKSLSDDYYEILDVSRNASTSEIQKAYREEARKCHPDVAGELGIHRFVEIQKAYEVLSDSIKRKEYDDADAIKFAVNSMDYARKLWAKRI